MPKPNDPDKDKYPKVPPFVGPKTTPHRNDVDIRGLLSIVTMIVSLGALTLALGGAGKIVLDIFDDGLADSLHGLWAKMIPLALAYLFGWGVALTSIRRFGNLVYPLIIQIYAWLCLAAVGGLYLKIMQKLYLQAYDLTKFFAYVFLLLGGLVVLLGLHLLVEGHDLRPFAAPLLILSVLQLFVIVFRYVFTSDAKAFYLFGDLAIFSLMISISALMLAHLGVFASVRSQIDNWFNQNENGNGNGKPKEEDQQHWVK